MGHQLPGQVGPMNGVPGLEWGGLVQFWKSSWTCDVLSDVFGDVAVGEGSDFCMLGPQLGL